MRQYSFYAFCIALFVSCGVAFASPALDVPGKVPSADGSYSIADESKADDIKVLEPKDIALLSNDELIAAYIDVAVEIEGAKVFHSTSGFTPKEYRKYKGWLKYRMQLLFEVYRRKLDIPAEAK